MLFRSATAYTSSPQQASGDPAVGAWGDELVPGVRAIAVSPDLVERGLRHGVEVQIEGLDGTWTVLDKMPARWSQKIDIYMGSDLEAARQWGRRNVTIRW